MFETSWGRPKIRGGPKIYLRSVIGIGLVMGEGTLLKISGAIIFGGALGISCVVEHILTIS